MDAFDTLGLTPAFDLDVSALDQRYRDLQKQLHPDKFAQSSMSQKRVSLSRAVNVNDAYRVLKDELKRAEALYVRYGGKATEKDQSPAAPELLMEVMELRESLSEAKAARDLDAAQKLSREVEQNQNVCRDALRTAFAALALDRSSPQLADAGRALSRLRYYRRFQDEVARLEEDVLG